MITFEFVIGIITGGLMVTTQMIYIKDIIQIRVRPSLLSWFGWFLLMGASLWSQIDELGWEWSLMGVMVSVLGCFMIAMISLFKNNFSLKKMDWLVLLCGLVCVGLFIVSKDPVLTTIYAVVADFLIGIPTIIKAYNEPASEKSVAWKIGLLTWTLSLLICFNHDWVMSLFPMYLFIFSFTMVVLQNRKIR
jgi:hypothetical protein